MTIMGGLPIEGGFKPFAHHGNVFSNFLGGLKIKKSAKKLVRFVVIKIMNHWMPLPYFKQTKCKSYEIVRGAINYPFTVAQLKFFSFIAGYLKPHLTICQPQKPLISFLHDDLLSLYRELIGLTIKSEFLWKCEDDCKELLKIYLRVVKNHMKRRICMLVLGHKRSSYL